jgi:EPS-associated MarR family transcriptional regulator
MIEKEKKLNPDIHFRLLHTLSDDSCISQRDLAKKLGISLGAANYNLRGLIKIGHVKGDNFKNNLNKIGYFYLITPIGIKEKVLLTNDF